MCFPKSFFFFFALVSLVVAPSAEGGQYRIIAGRRATTYEFPFIVRLERHEAHWCGGAIIHESFVLTAAHCIFRYKDQTNLQPYDLQIRVGSDQTMTGGQVRKVQKVIPHENYKDDVLMDQYDIGLVKITTPFEFNDRVNIISLAKRAPKEGEMAWVAGYGKQKIMKRSSSQKRHLMAIQIPIISLKSCRKILDNVADDMICAGHKRGHRDSCTGDSGGPMVVNNRLAGLVAWGIGCGREGLPGVYTNLVLYKKWIAEKIAENQ